MSSQITIQAAQDQVDQWIKTIGVNYFNELTNLGVLMEEVGELSRLMVRKYGDQSFKNKEANADLGDEMADVLFVLICLANQTGIYSIRFTGMNGVINQNCCFISCLFECSQRILGSIDNTDINWQSIIRGTHCV